MAVIFTDDELKCCKIVKRIWNEDPIKSGDPFAESNADRFSLSSHFVTITTGKYQADVMCNIAGKKGSGKSYSSVEEGRLCGIKTAIEKDNDPAKWKDYFDIERNVAIMDSDKLIDILTSKEKNQTIISDDTGVVIGAKKFRSDENQLIDDVFVVNRTQNNIYLSSSPEAKHVDRQARDLPEHQLDFQKNEALMSCGYAICKYFQKITDPKTSESYHQYHYWNNAKVLRCLIPKPPKEMCDEYDKLREQGKRRIQEKLKELKEKRNQDAPEKPKIDSRTKRHEERIQRAEEIYNQEISNGSTHKEAVLQMAKELRISTSTVNRMFSDGVLDKINT